jgi:hypothetical protein
VVGAKHERCTLTAILRTMQLPWKKYNPSGGLSLRVALAGVFNKSYLASVIGNGVAAAVGIICMYPSIVPLRKFAATVH